MGWMLALIFLVIGILTGDTVLALQIIALFTVGVLVLKWGDKKLAEEKAERLAKEKERLAKEKK